MKKQAIFILIFMIFFSIFPFKGAEGASFSVNKEKSNVTEKGKNIKIGDSKEIIANGYGLSKEKALKNAFQNAIQQFVGVFVDSEIQIKNGQLIKDNILTASNGFVQNYEMISASQEDGLFSVQIKANVKSQKIFEKVKALNIATTAVEGSSNVQARIETRAIVKEDAEKILKNNFEEFFSAKSLKEMLVLTIKDVKILEDKVKDEMVPVNITYSLAIDYKVYLSKLKHLEQTFENLGGKLHKNYDFPELNKDGFLGTKNRKRLKKMTKNQYFFIYQNGIGYRMDKWIFPENYSALFPFDMQNFDFREKLDFRKIFQITLEISGESGIIRGEIKTPNKFQYLLITGINSGRYQIPPYENCIMGVAPLMRIHESCSISRIVSGRDDKILVDIPVSEVGNIKNVTITLEEI